MTDGELRYEISENQKIVFDNRQSFVKRFLPSTTEEVNFYMGSAYHFVAYVSYDDVHKTRLICNDVFSTWKQSLNKDDSNG